MMRSWWMLSIALGCAMTVFGCSSTVLINSVPPGADVYVDGQHVGKTPAQYSDQSIVFTRHTLELKMDGYKDQRAEFSRQGRVNAGALVGGFFLWPFLLWALDYPASLSYPLMKTETSSLPADVILDARRYAVRLQPRE